MPYAFPNNTFDPDHFMNSLMEAMNMRKEDTVKVQALKNAMATQMTCVILRAAALHIEPEVMDTIMEERKNETNLVYLARDLIRHSPQAQLAILAALDEFYDQTLDAFTTLAQPHE